MSTNTRLPYRTFMRSLDGTGDERREAGDGADGYFPVGNRRSGPDAELFEGRDRRDRRQRGWRAQCLVADFPGAQRRRLDDPRGRRLLLGRRGDGIDRLQGFEGNAEESDRDREDDSGERRAAGAAAQDDALPG